MSGNFSCTSVKQSPGCLRRHHLPQREHSSVVTFISQQFHNASIVYSKSQPIAKVPWNHGPSLTSPRIDVTLPFPWISLWNISAHFYFRGNDSSCHKLELWRPKSKGYARGFHHLSNWCYCASSLIFERRAQKDGFH